MLLFHLSISLVVHLSIFMFSFLHFLFIVIDWIVVEIDLEFLFELLFILVRDVVHEVFIWLSFRHYYPIFW